MSKILLNDTHSIDLPTFIDTRLLVQANSGGGKSWLLRRLLEQSHGKVQQIVIDLEGEFSTLREKYDYILVGKEGDTPAAPRSASLLARRLLELHVSAIIDLYELSHQERRHFVRLFLSAMINAPKALWHPCLVIIDEAHVFCPQVGQSEAMEAVIDLATRGRKRGYCAVLATQRLSKLHKDAVAECLPGDQKILTRDGYRPIAEIRVGDYVLSHTGRYRKVISTFKREYRGDLIELKSKGSNISTLVTPNHPLLVTRRKLSWQGNKVISRSFDDDQWIKAENLSSKDYVVFPTIVESSDVESIAIPFSWSHKLRDGTSEVRSHDIVTKNIDSLLVVAGYYLAEGSIAQCHERQNSYKVEFSFGKSDRELSFVNELAESLASIGLQVTTYKKRGYYALQCASSAMATWLADTFGRGTQNKRIPAFIKQLPPEKLETLLKAYLNGDGHRPKTGEEIGRTVSEQLAVDLRDIALRTGRGCSIYKYAPPLSLIRSRFANLRDFYIVQISKVNASSQGSILKSNDKLYLKVNSIRRVSYSGAVYNLEVEVDNSFCTVNQTLHNCNNKLIGRTGLDIDRKRAAEELGFTTKEDALSLRNLPPGEFYAFGPAISESVEKVTVGPVMTSHPKAGARIITQTTPPTDNIRKIIAQLADLPQEAKQEAESLETLKTENATLKRLISQIEKQRPIETTKIVTVERASCDHDKALRQIQSIVSKALGTVTETPTTATLPLSTEKKPIVGGALRMLQVLASRYPMTFTKPQLALLANMSPKSGTYGTYLSSLKSQHLIEVGSEVSITEDGLAYVGTEKPKPQTQEEVLDMWRNNLTGGARRIFDVLVNAYPQTIEKTELGGLTEMSSNSGTFGTYLSLLRRNGLVEVTGTDVRANPNIFVRDIFNQDRET